MLTISLIKNNNSYIKTNYASKPIFGYRLPQDTFTDIRDIPKLKCAICGEDMFTQEDLNKFLQTFIPNSKRALNSEKMKPYRETPAFLYLLSLSEKSPNTKLSNLIKQNENHIQKFDEKNKRYITEIANIAETTSIRAPQAIKKFEKIRPLLSKESNEILDMFEIYSLKYPNDSFAEIIQRPEVFKRHNKMKERNEKAAFIQKINTLKKIKVLSDSMPAQDIRKVKIANNDALEKINKPFYKPDLKRFLIKDIYLKLVDDCSDKKTARNILKESKKLPCDSDAVNKFLTECAKEKLDDNNILKLIAQDAISTFEHIKPKSKNGEDKQSNGIALHKHCNQERANIDYPLFLRYKPQMKRNIKKQIDKVITFINNKKLKDYDSYPIEVKETLINETQNKININIQKYIKFKEMISITRLEKAQAAVEADTKKYEDADKKLREAAIRLEEIMNTVRQLKKEKAKCLASFEEAKDSMEFSKNMFEKADNDYKEIQTLIEKDKELSDKARK